MTIIFSRFRLSPSTRVAIALCQRTFGHHNLSLNTFKGPSGTPRPGHWITMNPISARELKPLTPFPFHSFPRECVTDYTEHQRDLRVIPMTQTPSLEPWALQCR